MQSGFKMNYSEYLPYAAAVAIAIPFLVLGQRFMASYIRMKNDELRVLNAGDSRVNRMAAYEKLTIFLERLKPSALVSRFDKSLEPHEFIFLIEKAVSEELEYNTPQQLYISKNLWQQIVLCKTTVLRQAHEVYESLKTGATLDDFKTFFLMNYLNGEDIVSDTIDQLKREAHTINIKQ